MILNVDDILGASSLHDTISKYVELKMAGTNMIACCPFHDEKTPSFVVSVSKGIYKCFGCGKGGNNAAQFLMDLKSYTFPEAIEILANEAGMVVDYGTENRDKANKAWKAQKAEKERHLVIHKAAYEILQSTYPNTPTKLAGKIYEEEIIKKWGIILSNNSNTLANHKLKDDFIEVGLVTQGQDNDYDFFYNRIMIPIHNKSGDIVGYTARHKHIKPKAPKYINSKNSCIFKKSKILFGYHHNQQAIKNKGFAYLVEGATDVIMMDQHGCSNAVGILGTSFTDDHAKLLAQITDTVIIMMDGDEAGKKSKIKAVEVLVKNKLKPSILTLPFNDDPADYITKKGLKGFKTYSDANTEDGITHSVSLELDGTEHGKVAAVNKAALLLSSTDNEILLEQYAKTISRKIGTTQKVLKDEIKKRRDQLLSGRKLLTPEQENQKLKYHMFEDGNKYYTAYGKEISNYVLTPLFLVHGGNHQNRRIFEITNIFKDSRLIDIPTDDFIMLNSFRKLTEGIGNFVFEGKEENFLQLRKMVYEKMMDVYSITTLGYQPGSGCYAWSNGLTNPNGEFMSINEYGIVEFDDKKYFLPTFSKLRDMETEDLGSSEFEECFQYIESEDDQSPKTVEEWTSLFAEILGENAIIGLSFYFATVFKDILFRRFNGFPLLNLFGPQGSGKTFMARLLVGPFGIPQRPTHSVSGTLSSFFRVPAQSRNAISNYEEFSEKVPDDKVEGFKNFFDGFGRQLSKLTKDNQTNKTPVHNSIVLAGQVMPAHDPALLSRCITLYFATINESEIPKEIKKKAERFTKWTMEGYFSYVTAKVHSFRGKFSKEFDVMYEEVSKQLSSMFPAKSMPDARVFTNYAMMVTTYKVMSQFITLPFQTKEVLDFTCERIIDQSLAIKGTEEFSEWWKMIEYLIEKGELTSSHYAVQELNSVTINDGSGKKELIWDAPKKLLFLNLNYAHKEYLRHGKMQGLARTLGLNTLKHYFKIHNSYIGQKKSKRMGPKKVAQCWVFDTDLLSGYSFNITNYSTEEGQKEEDEYTNDFENRKDPPSAQQEMIFQKDPKFNDDGN